MICRLLQQAGRTGSYRVSRSPTSFHWPVFFDQKEPSHRQHKVGKSLALGPVTDTFGWVP